MKPKYTIISDAELSYKVHIKSKSLTCSILVVFSFISLINVLSVSILHRSGGACTAAAFLREFVTSPHWAHLDIAGVMSNKDEVPYLRKGMSGRPTRTLVEFAAGLAHSD